MNTPPTTEERIWAVLSHLSALTFGMGILLPIIGWSDQRRKSRYASFQCLQALGYQSLGYTVWLLSYLLVLVITMVLIFTRSFWAEASGRDFDPLEGPMMALIFGGGLIFLILYVLLPVLAAIACALGRDYRYPVLGNRLAEYVGYEGIGTEEAGWLAEAHEERWVASMGHFSVIIALWGLLAPLTAWALQGKKSAFLKYQSLQTAVYQAFVNILYFAAGVLYLTGLILVFAVLGLEGNPNLGSFGGMVGIGLFFATFLLAALIVLAVPLFHILGQWAGYRVLKGDMYRYPLVGRLAEKWMVEPRDGEQFDSKIVYKESS